MDHYARTSLRAERIKADTAMPVALQDVGISSIAGNFRFRLLEPGLYGLSLV